MQSVLIQEMLSKPRWAVIGAAPQPERVSHRIFQTLRAHGYQVYAVNPKYDEIEPGVRCYPSLDDLPEVPDCVDFVVNPSLTLRTLQQMNPQEVPYVWFQPGSYDDAVIAYAEEHGFRAVHQSHCVMVELKR